MRAHESNQQILCQRRILPAPVLRGSALRQLAAGTHRALPVVQDRVAQVPRRGRAGYVRPGQGRAVPRGRDNVPPPAVDLPRGPI